MKNGRRQKVLLYRLVRSLDTEKLSSQSTCENGGKKSCKERREKMSNPFLSVRDRWLETEEASQERRKEEEVLMNEGEAAGESDAAECSEAV